jgi:hypothetical protein
MTNNKKAQLLPFHAINEFMRDDFRNQLLQEVFSEADKLEKDQVVRINRLFSKGVQISGFRNSSLAPIAFKVRHANGLFEKSPEFVSIIVNCWSKLHQPLKEATWQLLENRNWRPLPLDVDRSLLSGFMLNWPKEDTFETLIHAFREKTQEIVESDDNISLMIVWVGNKLPYGLYDETTP